MVQIQSDYLNMSVEPCDCCLTELPHVAIRNADIPMFPGRETCGLVGKAKVGDGVAAGLKLPKDGTMMMSR